MCAALDVIYKVQNNVIHVTWLYWDSFQVELGLPRDKISSLIHELFIPVVSIWSKDIDGN